MISGWKCRGLLGRFGLKTITQTLPSSAIAAVSDATCRCTSSLNAIPRALLPRWEPSWMLCSMISPFPSRDTMGASRLSWLWQPSNPSLNTDRSACRSAMQGEYPSRRPFQCCHVQSENKEEIMRLGFNGATTQTADLGTEMSVGGQAGYDVIELRDNKLDQFLAQGSLDDVHRMLREAGVAAWTINSIERVGVDGAAGTARAVERCRELSRYAQAIECPWVLIVTGPTEGRTD